jgi:hypothetical protein
MIELKRTELLTNLEGMARSGSLLVVGGPGAGKSWLLRQFAAQRDMAGDAVLLLLAEEHNYVESLSQLEESLKLPAGVISTLKAYTGEGKFLIIDSLDALRAEASQRVFRQLIRLVHRELPEWKVIASIRSFDAKESLELQRLFPASGDEPVLLNARHIAVPVFSDTDFDEAKAQDVRLAPILSAASASVREILRNAFNLWLVIHLLDEKVGVVEWLYALESEVQLFERYWYYRIAARDDRYDRLSILSNVSAEMVKSRTLSVPLNNAYTVPGTSQTFQSLLSDEVFRKTHTNRVAYSHNILFDFSVSKLLLDEQRLLPFLRDPDRSIFFRPSVSYFLTLLWYGDRDAFWRMTSVFYAPDSNLPARVHVLPGMTVFNSTTKLQELGPLLALPGSIGSNMILSVLRATQAFGGMTSRRSSIWLHLICELSDRLDITFLNEYLALIETASHQTNWTQEEQQRLTSASIRLLTWMWNEATVARTPDAAEQLLSIAAGRVIPVVARFYSVDPKEVRAALRLVLDRIGKPDVSASEAYSLANNLQPIIDVDPAFAADVYSATFAHEEKSRKKTQIGGSKVLVLTSTRAQDYSMAYYILGVRFHHFLSRDLTYAAMAAIRSVGAQVQREHVKTARRIGRYSARFTFVNVKSRLVADGSQFWDQGYRDNVSLQILDALLNEISDRLKSDKLTHEATWALFRMIAKENRFPVVWKRVMEHASRSRELLPFAVPLLQAPEILAAPETTVLAGDLIAQYFTGFSAEEKQKIEEAIWAIPGLPLTKTYRAPDDQRNRLLGCIPENELSERSRSVIRNAKASGALVRNEPFFKVGSVSQIPFTPEDWLRDHGTDTDAAPNRRLLDAKIPLSAFEGKYLNEIPSQDESESILPALQAAVDTVTQTTDADERVIDDLFTSIAAVAESIVKNEKLGVGSAVVSLSRKILAKAAVYPRPEPSEKADENFDMPAWGPTPKIEAAQGLMHVVSNWGLDNELERLILILSTDRSPAVRFQIANGLGGIYNHSRELFWKIADSMQAAEKATGVSVALARIVGHAYIAKQEPENVVRWLKVLLRRKSPKRRSEDVYGAIFDSLIYLYVYLNVRSANQLLRSIEKSPMRRARLLQIMANSASYYLDYNLESSDSAATEVRVRAREVELRILDAVDHAFRSIEGPLSAPKRGAANRAEAVQQLLVTVDRLVFRLHMIINANPQLQQPDDKPASDQVVRDFFKESAELWDAVVSADSDYRRPIGPSTAHHLMESFNRLLPFNPEHVLKLAWRLITGRTLGYQFDQMAIGEFVGFAEKILADHRALLREEVNAVRFAEILDVFVSAGWPQATQIVLRMDAAVR